MTKDRKSENLRKSAGVPSQHRATKKGARKKLKRKKKEEWGRNDRHLRMKRRRKRTRKRKRN
jgi:hypothetical protein